MNNFSFAYIFALKIIPLFVQLQFTKIIFLQFFLTINESLMLTTGDQHVHCADVEF